MSGAVVLDAFRAALKDAGPDVRYGMRLYLHGLDHDTFNDAPGRLDVDGDLAWKTESFGSECRIIRYPEDSLPFVNREPSDVEIYGAGVR